MRTLIACLIIGFFTSCATQHRCQEKFPPAEKHTIERTIIKKDSLLKGATVHDTISQTLWNNIPIYKTIVKKDTSGLAELTWYKDQYGNLVASCHATDRIIQRIEELEKSLQEKTTVKARSFWQKIGDSALTFISGIVFAFLWGWITRLRKKLKILPSL